MKPTVSAIDFAFQSPFQFGLFLCSLAFLTHKLARLLSDRRRNPLRLPLPPGPKGYPLIGNVLDMPTAQQWRTYAQWGKIYGDKIHFKFWIEFLIQINRRCTLVRSARAAHHSAQFFRGRTGIV